MFEKILLAIFFGIIQGLAEFLPISSSGHLTLINMMIGKFSDQPLLFFVFLHLGTFFSVLFYLRKKIINLFIRYLKRIIIASIPAFFAGFFLHDFFETLFSGTKFLPFAFLITTIFNFLIDLFGQRKNKIDNTKAFLIGLFQSLAIVPGISRSGSTIFASFLLGVKENEAFIFSLLLSIVAILGANFLEILKGLGNGFDFWFFLISLFGFLASFFVGLFAINVLFRVLVKKRFRIFGIYTLFISLISFIFIFL